MKPRCRLQRRLIPPPRLAHEMAVARLRAAERRLHNGEIVTTRAIEPLICALLQRHSVRPPAADSSFAARFIHCADAHRLLPLLDAEIERRGDGAGWPEAIRTACREGRRVQALFELAHGAELARVIEALAARGIPAILLKGTALAYGVYADPALRPREDTDLLVPPESRVAAQRVLEGIGYRRVIGPAGAFVGYQMALHRRAPNGIRHALDLHWRLSDVQSFAWLFGFDELAARAVPLPALGANALRLGNAHELLTCLLHRATNNVFVGGGFGDRLGWLYDIHLLIEAMPDAEIAELRALVRRTQLAAIAIDGLQACARALASRRLCGLANDLARDADGTAGSDWLSASRARREWLELCAVPGAARRIRYAARRGFPDRSYMRERYPDAASQPLLLLHARRWASAIRRHSTTAAAMHGAKAEIAVELASEIIRRNGELRFRATGSSMLPAVRAGDLLVARCCRPGEAVVGDIVLAARRGRLFAHRLIARSGEAVVTQGDAVPEPDPPVPDADFLGKVVEIVRDGGRRALP